MRSGGGENFQQLIREGRRLLGTREYISDNSTKNNLKHVYPKRRDKKAHNNNQVHFSIFSDLEITLPQKNDEHHTY